MGCGNCGTGASGKPSGCKSNGGCSTGGCNRLNVFDWLSELPLHDGAKPYSIVEMSFNKGSRKEFFRNNTNYIVQKGDMLVVEGVGGYDVGQVSLTGELVKLQLKKYGVTEQSVTKRVLHPATDDELETSDKHKSREQEALVRSRAIAKQLNLDMKLCEVEIQADGKKGTFFYTADQRVDFRELIKLFASDFRMKIEMKQIGARQESGKVGGIGSCGRELCCSTWLTDFKSVNTTAARYQNLAINQTKLSGQCGRLKCCLNYELDTYMDALSVFPDHVDRLDTAKGTAYLQKRDIFKSLMWYSYSDSSKQYPLTITRVKEIQQLNKQGQKVEELQPVELEVKTNKEGIKVDVGFVNDVGQITLKNLEKNKKKKKKPGNKPQGAAAPVTEGGQPQQARPQQQKAPGQGGKPQQEGQQRQQRPQGQQNRPQQPRPEGQKPQGQQQQPKPGEQGQGKPQGQQQPKQEGQQRQQGQQRSQGQQQNKPQQQNRPQQQKGNPQQKSDQQQGQPQQPKPEQQGQQPKQGQQGQGQQRQRPPRHNRPQGQRPEKGGAEQGGSSGGDKPQTESNG